MQPRVGDVIQQKGRCIHIVKHSPDSYFQYVCDCNIHGGKPHLCIVSKDELRPASLGSILASGAKWLML